MSNGDYILQNALLYVGLEDEVSGILHRRDQVT